MNLYNFVLPESKEKLKNKNKTKQQRRGRPCHKHTGASVEEVGLNGGTATVGATEQNNCIGIEPKRLKKNPSIHIPYRRIPDNKCRSNE